MMANMEAPEAPEALEALEATLGHRFSDRSLLERALMHRSWSHERGEPGVDSESMEFLGDAVLSLVVSRMIFDAFGQAEVGEMARARGFLVSETNLARKAREVNLGAHLKLGRGEERGGGRDKDSLLADAYEAVLAAVYLDGGLEVVTAFIAGQFAGQVERLLPGASASQDYKTDLQEALQGVALPIPVYRVAGSSGPDHRKSFTVELMVSGRLISTGTGSTKKAAEQVAAGVAMRDIASIIELLTADLPSREP